MNCGESEVLMHALIDGELDAGHTSEVEAHLAACPACVRKLAAFRTMREAMAAAGLKETAPARLRSRIGENLSLPPLRTGWFKAWRTFFGGLAVGTVLSGAVAASLVVAVIRNDPEQMIANEVVSAHLRSLQAGHLTDVETSDQHTVKPWFNGKLDVAPPVIDLAAQGFTLVGGRLDYIGGEPAASIVYRRRQHVINLFIARRAGISGAGQKAETVQGFNIRSWSEDGLKFWAVSDLNAGELAEFGKKFIAALHG